MNNVLDLNGSLVGVFDGEYLKGMNGQHDLRIDGDEVYTTDIPCKYVGTFNGDNFINLRGKVVFTLLRHG